MSECPCYGSWPGENVHAIKSSCLERDQRRDVPNSSAISLCCRWLGQHCPSIKRECRAHSLAMQYLHVPSAVPGRSTMRPMGTNSKHTASFSYPKVSYLRPDTCSFRWLDRLISFVLYPQLPTNFTVRSTLLPWHHVFYILPYRATNHARAQLWTPPWSISQGLQDYFLLLKNFRWSTPGRG